MVIYCHLKKTKRKQWRLMPRVIRRKNVFFFIDLVLVRALMIFQILSVNSNSTSIEIK